MAGMADDDDFDGISLDQLRRRRSSKWVTYPPDVLPAFVAELDVPIADPVRRALHDAVDLGDLGYTEPVGLADAVAGYAAAAFDWAVDPADVHLVPDVMTGLIDVVRALGDPGGAVVVNPPVYPPFFTSLPESGCRVVEAPLARDGGGYTFDLDALAAAFRAGARVHLLCSPHNPVGRVWTEAELRGVAELADRYGVLVLADEIHAPLALPGSRHVPFATIAGDRCVTFTSASKAWNLAGLKCAVAVTSGPRGRELVGRLPRVVHRPPEASYLSWLDLSAYGLGDDPAQVLLERGRVALEPGPHFGRQGAGFARLNIGTSRSLLTEAVDRMAAALA